MKITQKALGELIPYENNPRRIGEDAVNAVAESIRQFGFRVPIVVDAHGVIVCGHTRYQAAQSLGLASVPCVVADDLTPEQVKAFRLADNRTSELTAWDFSALETELDALSDAFDMGAFGFDLDAVSPDTPDFSGAESAAGGYPESRPEDLKPYAPQPQGAPAQDAAPPVSRETNFRYREQYAVTVICRDEAQQEEIYGRLTAEGYDCRVVCV